MEKGDFVLRTTAGVRIDTSGYDGFWSLGGDIALLKDSVVFIVWLPSCDPQPAGTWNGMFISTIDAVPELLELLDSGEDPDDWPALDSYSNPISPSYATPCGDDLEPLPFCVELGDSRGRIRVEMFATLGEANTFAEDLWNGRERADDEYIVSGMYAWPCGDGRAAVEVPGGFRRGRRPSEVPMWVIMTRGKGR
ncbi:MAG: hypothetical protein Q4Q58_04270 [Thermoplasmata archaeon]|nr:hypothetical protein [Thermoplasmata archaeon]